jgi:hypothetical protein
MTTYTRAQLITQALTDLGVIAEGQSVSDNDTSKMDGYIDAAMSELADLEIYYVADYGQPGPTGGNIEASAFLSLARYLAKAACMGFNLPADPKVDAESQQAVAKLRTLSGPARAKARLRVDPLLVRGYRGFWNKFPNNF